MVIGLDRLPAGFSSRQARERVGFEEDFAAANWSSNGFTVIIFMMDFEKCSWGLSVQGEVGKQIGGNGPILLGPARS